MTYAQILDEAMDGADFMNLCQINDDCASGQIQTLTAAKDLACPTYSRRIPFGLRLQSTRRILDDVPANELKYMLKQFEADVPIYVKPPRHILWGVPPPHS